ncbi:unnamed protein product [Rotaria sp. Silwood2]|nr:unnamed protein product [Rotaria sp. Silwood2]CAF3268569.1 unnamed protein product [Rotaria sp. Silwood2]CAF3524726.1 unnamed protein product [Rotaria sp. Silwood2]
MHNWWDVRNDEIQWLPAFQTAATRAQRFLRRFIDKARTISPELFEFYILSKAMPMYLQMHIEETPFIDALRRGRPNSYIRNWMQWNNHTHPHKCYLDHLSAFLSASSIAQN